ncbi:DUF6906 family protein [Listeria fleischmannii]|uniref:DUF6906 domain-containing protein n=1 Tax=Listeria fleischmannii TaxID=1069827 RepID=A0A841YIQ4_9LIST|nr:hypothetical protein [Listeria fleischmannii]MBC1399918.1 hypothetical protein [Listeria fleischmannii]
MKGNPKNPTHKQKQVLKAHKKAPENWWVVGKTTNRLFIQHKISRKYYSVKWLTEEEQRLRLR